MKKESSLVSVANKSQYHDTKKTPLVTYKTLIIFSFFGAVSRKQHTIRTSHLLSHEICFYSIMSDFKEIFAIS